MDAGAESTDLPDDLAPALDAEIGRLTAALERAIGAEDRARMAELVHEIKGLSGYFGLEALTVRVRRLEAAITDAPAEQLVAMLDEIRGVHADRG